MITLNKLTKRYGPKVLFENVTLTFDPAKRYVLVGANGAGKSTLLRIVSGEEDSDQGSVEIPSKLKVGVLKQDHSMFDGERILDTVLMGNRVLWDAMQEKERILAKGEAMTDDDGMRLAELEGVVAEEDGYTAESRAGEVLDGLGIPGALHEQRMSSLAAGYKPRALLAQTLFGGADVLLLDEPTNHLDLDAIRWLEGFLTNDFKGTLLVVSHDRHFMNAIATHVADVDYQTVTFYTGDYDDFVEQKTTGRRQAESDVSNKKKKIAELKEFVAKFGASANRSSQAQSRVKEIERLEGGLELKRSSVVRPYVKFLFDKPSGRDVLRVEGLGKAFGDKQILRDFSMNLTRGERLAVIGPSGAGKSTLLKMLVKAALVGLSYDAERLHGVKALADYAPDAGQIVWGHDTNVGYFAQEHHEALEAGLTAYAWLHRFDTRREVEEVRATLGRLLFSGEAGLKKTDSLSGGEAARLLLAKLILLKNNVLVMDEPTTHLDVESIAALVEALSEFKGTVIVTSHDRYFVSTIATKVLELSSAGPNLWNGTYEEFLEKHGTEYLRR
ncbi:MAG: ATP-binding cassette domain-containing protein [Polyangiaceae bacterium]|nr:ATP-binding cassette domain-containing protein [Polyangiaceae bacterium]